VEGAYAKGNNKVLCYKDIDLTLLCNPEPGKRDVLVMEVTLFHTKGGLGQRDCKFWFDEVKVIYFLTHV
jgi:hypothetical protein